jgi:hypothetical protein
MTVMLETNVVECDDGKLYFTVRGVPNLFGPYPDEAAAQRAAASFVQGFATGKGWGLGRPVRAPSP